jgi:hypothetical protein
VGLNEFEFTSLSVYNFKVSEETFGLLSQSEVKISIDDLGAAGSLTMGRLLLAPNFQLKTVMDLTQSVEVEDKTAAPSKLKQPKNKKAKAQEAVQTTHIETSVVGQISIELNLQQGDTEEELMRNYKMKLDQQEEYRKKQAEIETLERRHRSVMQMEA